MLQGFLLKPGLLVLLGALLIFSVGCEPPVEDKEYSVVVEVLDYQEEPLEGMKVTTTPETEMAETDEDGQTHLTELENDVEIEVIDEDEYSFLESQEVSPDQAEETITFEPEETRGYLQGTITLEEELESSKTGFLGLMIEPPFITGIEFEMEAGQDTLEYRIGFILEEQFVPGEKYPLYAEVGDPENNVYYGYYGVEDPEVDKPQPVQVEPLKTKKDLDFTLFPAEEFEEGDLDTITPAEIELKSR